MIKYCWRIVGTIAGMALGVGFRMYLNHLYPTVAKAITLIDVFGYCIFLFPMGWMIDSLEEKRRWKKAARESTPHAIATVELRHSSGLKLAKALEECVLVYEDKGIWIHQKTHKSFIAKEQIISVVKKEGSVETGTSTYKSFWGGYSTYSEYASYYSLLIAYISQSGEPEYIGFLGKKSKIADFELAINGRPEAKMRYEEESQAYHL